ncbi:MAG: hypothetical protein AAF900_01155 [Bacteroidota bacterium]
MQDKSKQSHTSIHFYLVVAILIIAICISIGYVVNRHHVLQDMIQKNHISDSPFLHLLKEAEKYFAPVAKHLTPFQPIINILFTILLIELGGQFISRFVPKSIKNSTKKKKESWLGEIEKWTKNSIQRLRRS